MQPPKQKITFGKFQNVDLRVAVIKRVQDAVGTRCPSKILDLDVGELGERRSVGQFALVDSGRLLDSKVVVCVNLSEREIGGYVSQALVLGTPHPDSPSGQDQAVPLWADPLAQPGDAIF
jgi:tRNA-binding protein